MYGFFPCHLLRASPCVISTLCKVHAIHRVKMAFFAMHFIASVAMHPWHAVPLGDLPVLAKCTQNWNLSWNPGWWRALSIAACNGLHMPSQSNFESLGTLDFIADTLHMYCMENNPIGIHDTTNEWNRTSSATETMNGPAGTGHRLRKRWEPFDDETFSNSLCGCCEIPAK